MHARLLRIISSIAIRRTAMRASLKTRSPSASPFHSSSYKIAPRAIGHNNPPEPTPYEAILTDVQDLSETAQGFLDGDPINDQATADMVAKLRSEEHTSELQSLMRI